MTIHIAKWLPSLALIVTQPFPWSSWWLAGHGLTSCCTKGCYLFVRKDLVAKNWCLVSAVEFELGSLWSWLLEHYHSHCYWRGLFCLLVGWRTGRVQFCETPLLWFQSAWMESLGVVKLNDQLWGYVLSRAIWAWCKAVYVQSQKQEAALLSEAISEPTSCGCKPQTAWGTWVCSCPLPAWWIPGALAWNAAWFFSHLVTVTTCELSAALLFLIAGFHGLFIACHQFF